MVTVDLELLYTGYHRQIEGLLIRGGEWRRKRLHVPIALITHPDYGSVLVDTGYSAHFFEQTSKWPYRLFRWFVPAVVTKPIIGHLAERGLAPHDLYMLWLTHFHLDHVAGLRDFVGVPTMFYAPAYQEMKDVKGLTALRKAYVPGLLPESFERQIAQVGIAEMAALSGDYAPFSIGFDIFGDGSVVAVLLPGHAPGHTGLFMDTAEFGRVLFITDACFHSREYRELLQPGPLSSSLLNDRKQHRATLERIHDYHQRHPDVPIWPAHCPEVYAFWMNRSDTSV